MFTGAKIRYLAYRRKLYWDRRARKLALDAPRCRIIKRRKKVRLKKPPLPGVWRAPREFDCSDVRDRSSLLRSLADLRYRIGIKKEGTCLDFSRTHKMYAAGTLLFVAELRRLIRYVEGSVEITCKLPDSNKICQVLKQIGVLDLLGVSTDVIPVDPDVVHWRYAHGERVLGEKYEDILSDYDGEIAEALQSELYTGLTEAMTNVLNHAYSGVQRNDGLSIQTSEWWMFSQELDGKLSIVFCDLGAGIPRTLPLKRPSVWERVKRLGKTNDAFAIEYAVRDSISRTREEHRGKGLGQIVRVAANVPGGGVSIFSNRGAYDRYWAKSHLTHYDDSIMGTLIYWVIPLQSEAKV